MRAAGRDHAKVEPGVHVLVRKGEQVLEQRHREPHRHEHEQPRHTFAGHEEQESAHELRKGLIYEDSVDE